MVGDRPVEYAAYAAYVKAAAREEPKNVSPKVASSLLDQYLEELLLARAVESADPPLKEKGEVERRRELIARLARVDEIGDAELKAEYDAHPERYRKPAVLRLSQLFLKTREDAEKAVRRLAAGAAWVDVSRELSIAPNASAGGSLGLLSRSDLPRDFEKAVWGVPAGKVSPILAATRGFHVFRVDERFEERVIPLEAAADLIAAARKAFPVVVVEEHLPFPYVGTSARSVG
jgi:parvulin-like peptidyl-prolyl isomerase